MRLPTKEEREMWSISFRPHPCPQWEGETFSFEGEYEYQLQWDYDQYEKDDGSWGTTSEKVLAEIPVLHTSQGKRVLNFEHSNFWWNGTSPSFRVDTQEEWELRQLRSEIKNWGLDTSIHGWEELVSERKGRAYGRLVEQAQALALSRAKDEAKKTNAEHIKASIGLLPQGLEWELKGSRLNLKEVKTWDTLSYAYMEVSLEASMKNAEAIVEFLKKERAPKPISTLQKVREELLASGLYKSVVIHPPKRNLLVLTLLSGEVKEYGYKGETEGPEFLVAIKNLLLGNIKPGRPMPKKKVK
jgi:hypothetical protein